MATRLLEQDARAKKEEMQHLYSESGDEESLDDTFPVNFLGDVEWTELMSASLRAETFRERARHYVQDVWLLQKRACLYEADCLQRSAQRVESECPDRVKLFAAKEAQKAAEAETQSLREMICEDGEGSTLESLASGYREWVAELNNLTPLHFIQYVTVLSVAKKQQDLVQFLSSLSLELSWWQVEERLRGIGDVRMALDQEGLSLSEWTPVLRSKPFHILFHQPNDRKPLTPQNLEKCMQRISGSKFLGASFGEDGVWRSYSKLVIQKAFHSDSACARRAFSISPCVQLFNVSNADVALMLKVLLDAGEESPCFNTPIGRAILAETARRTNRGHLLDNMVDFVYIIVLVRMAVCLESETSPATFTLMIFAGLSMTVAFSLILKLFGGMYLFMSNASGVAVGVLKHVNLWNVIFSLTEAFSTFVGWRFVIYAVYDEGKDISAAWKLFESHPAFLSCLVLVRWTQVGVSLLEVEGIGRHIVPVVHAVTRPASMNFLVFLSIVVFGSFHAYSVFPIAENYGSVNHRLNSFLKIFRLEVLGDFGLSELEGLGEVMNGTVSNGKISANLGEEGKTNIHYSLRMEFVILTLVVTVVAMNVYIGLLGELYSKAIEKKNRLYNHYLASSAYRFIGRNIGLRVLTCNLCRSVFAHPINSQSDGLMWFSYNQDLLLDPNAEDD